VVVAAAAVHEEMHQGAEREEQPGERRDEMGAVLRHEEVAGHDHDEQKGEPAPRAQRAERYRLG